MRLSVENLRLLLTLAEKAESQRSVPVLEVYEDCSSGIGSILYAEIDTDLFGHKGVFRVQLTDESNW